MLLEYKWLPSGNQYQYLVKLKQYNNFASSCTSETCPVGAEVDMYKNAHSNIAINSKNKQWKPPKYPLVEE